MTGPAVATPRRRLRLRSTCRLKAPGRGDAGGKENGVRLVLNGRFLGRPMTGVDRVALQLTRSMREVLATVPGQPDIAVRIPGRTIPRPDAVQALGEPTPVIRPLGRLRGHAWEQIELAGTDRDAWLLDLCNTGPMTRRRQAAFLFDALFLEYPDSFSPAFRWWYRALFSALGRRAATVFTCSAYSRAVLERYRLVPPGRTHVVYLGGDHLEALTANEAVFARIGAQPNGYVLAVGSLARHKNLDLLVRAFLAADLPGVELVIAGGSNPRIFAEAGLPTAPSVRYAGRVTDEELKALYRGAIAFACPSLSEGFGLPPIEAMFCDCPVIATTGGSVPEVCGEAAVYADPRDLSAWRDAIRRVVGDAGLREAMRQRGKVRAAGYTWRRAAIGMLQVLARADGDTALLDTLATAASRDG